MNRVETNISNRLLTVESDVKRLLNFLESGMSNSTAPQSADFELNTSFIKNIKSSIQSARSVVLEVRSSHSMEGPPSPSASAAAEDPVEADGLFDHTLA